MNLDLSDEHRIFRDAVDRFFAERSKVAGARHSDAEVWQGMAELGLLSLPFSEAAGGADGGAVETMLVHRAIGRSLAATGYLGGVTLPGALLRAVGSHSDALAANAATGTLRLAFAHREKGGPLDGRIGTRAERAGDGWRISGQKFHAAEAQHADRLIVSARVGDDLGLFLVDPRAAGVTARHATRLDGSGISDIRLDGVTVNANAELLTGPDAVAAIDLALDVADAARIAEATGAMEAMLGLTIEHLGTRKQFGRALREFQALQHRVADMYASLQMALAMSTYASLSTQGSDATERRRAVLAAKAQACQSGRFIGQQSIQMHGGMGMTAEHSVGKLFKRMTVLEMEMGPAEESLARLAAMGGVFPGDPDPLPEFDAAEAAA